MRKKILVIVAILVIPAVIYLVWIYFQSRNIHPIKMLEMSPLLATAPHHKSIVEQFTESLDKITASLSGIVGLLLLFKEYHTTKKKKRASKTPKA
jgi:hypothetical protein